jgi:Protein of unknown function (DUF2793)
MSDPSPRLGLPYIQPSQAQKHVTHNEALGILDGVTQLVVLEIDSITPPADPASGDCHGLGAAPTGAWAGQGDRLALWEGSVWSFVTPREGWRAWDQAAARLRVWRAGLWQSVPPNLEALTQLGIATTADATNRLAVAAPATLLSHDGGGHQLKINKAADSDTASLLFQSNWTGHAELGLAGDTAFALKLSADGASWSEVLRADPAAQRIDWAAAGTVQMSLSGTALQLDVPLSGTAVQSSATDTTVGQLLLNGAHGLGATDLSAVRFGDGETDLPSGFYSGSGSSADAATFPNGTSRYKPFLNLTRRVTAGAYEQLRLFFDDATMFARAADSAGLWGDPISFVTQATLLGPVSQSAGAPTGAVIERGSNANGDYVRFADGTQICTQSVSLGGATTSVGALFYEPGSTNWTYPAAFASGTQPAMSAACGDATRTVNMVSNSASIGKHRSFSPISSATTPTAKMTAIGRWF